MQNQGGVAVARLKSRVLLMGLSDIPVPWFNVKRL
jgi:hypothetical protein